MDAANRGAGWRAALCAGALAVAAGAGAWQLAPDRQGAGDPDGPSLPRLLGDVGEIARAPHPLGTAAHDRVRDHLVDQLRRLGLDPQIARGTSVAPAGPLVHVADVENVVVRIAGDTPGARAVLVASHYDSTPTSLGAADAGAGIASLLELARLLRAGPRHRNPVILLFSDGEERGLLGARSFVRDHPWAREVGAVINLEARGSAGRPVLIETGGAAPRLLRLIADARAPVLVGSYVTEAYRRSGNDTDFTVFHQAGWPGYNLAFFGDPASYHTARDAADRLDPAALHELASAAFRLCSALADEPLAALAGPEDALAASGPAGVVVAVPQGWGLGLAIAALGAIAALALAGRPRPRPRRILAAAAILLGTVIAAAVVAALVGALIAATAGTGRVRWEEGDGFLFGALLIAAAVAASGASQAARRCDRRELALGLGGLLAAAGVALAVALPATSHLATVPALALAGGLAAELVAPRAAQWIAPVLALPAAALWGQLLAVLAVGLGARAAIAVAIVAALAALVAAVFAHGALAALRWRPAAVLLAAGAAALGTGAWQPAVDRGHPSADHLVLAVDRDAGTARWAVFDPALDAWTAGIASHARPADLREFFGGRPTPALASPAMYRPHDGSRVEATRTGDRAIALRLVPAPGASSVRLDLYSAADLRAASIAGHALAIPPAPADRGQARLSILYLHPPVTGAELSLELSSAAEVDAVAIDIHQGELRDRVAARPAHVIPGTRWPTDAVLVRAAFRFPARP